VGAPHRRYKTAGEAGISNSTLTTSLLEKKKSQRISVCVFQKVRSGEIYKRGEKPARFNASVN
jgi:hypothetical protein